MNFYLPCIKALILFSTFCLAAQAAPISSAQPDATQEWVQVSSVATQQTVQKTILGIGDREKLASILFEGGVPGNIIDDFEDGDTSDWMFFPGNAAGGGGAPLSDRPYEGTFYLSTGWGGAGIASGFYGGSFKNFDNSLQVQLPSDPWFSVWVLNQSNATVDEFTLEITLREDLDGNGWTDGQEDSIKLATTFVSTDFNDQWTLISAPLSNFTNSGTGGDGTFNGALDEVVLVIAGVEGADPSTVEIDFDQFIFSNGNPFPPPNLILQDGFESGGR